jgi:hypothetical protein
LSIFGSHKQFDLEAELEKLYDEVATINNLATMVQTDGWDRFSGWAAGRIEMWDDEIVSMAKEPEKNASEMKYKYALRQVLHLMVAAVEASLAERDEKIGRLLKFKELKAATGR